MRCMRKIAMLLIALMVISIGFLSGCTDQTDTGENNQDTNNEEQGTGDTDSSEIEYEPPKITFITTASDVITYGDYTAKSSFDVGETVFLYYEYSKVNHDNKIDAYHTISIHHQDSWVSYYSNSYTDKNVGSSDDWCKWWEFETDDFPSGTYQVDIGLLDEISDKTATKTTYFSLVESSSNDESQVGYSRNNPAPIGTTLEFEDEDDWSYGNYKVKITLKNIIRGSLAWDMIEDANMFNDEPGSGNEYILAKIKFEYIESSEDVKFDHYDYNFYAVSEDGMVYDSPYIAQPEPKLDADLYPGSSDEGWKAFEVDVDDEHPLLSFGTDYQVKGGIWFDLYN